MVSAILGDSCFMGHMAKQILGVDHKSNHHTGTRVTSFKTTCTETKFLLHTESAHMCWTEK